MGDDEKDHNQEAEVVLKGWVMMRGRHSLNQCQVPMDLLSEVLSKIQAPTFLIVPWRGWTKSYKATAAPCTQPLLEETHTCTHTNIQQRQYQRQ
mmetsp:Transcript_72694/g.106570  ORF Transcript_72694/g.106570 Transcript_72694/m.106570 type:complete len:94 (-) Transcript_72694:463-744(-)